MNNIFDKLRERGYNTVPSDWYEHIDNWLAWYHGNVKSFHLYDVYTGQRAIHCRRYTVGMAKKVAEDWADLLLNEKASVTLEGEREQAFFDEVCRRNNFRVRANEMQELKAALGTAAYVLRVVGAEVDGETGEVTGNSGEIRIDYYTAPEIIPLSWDAGVITDCAFVSSATVGGKTYRYVQIHRYDGGEYVIENIMYLDENGSLTETALSSVPGYERVPPVIHTGTDKRQFYIDRLAITNNLDTSVPMGISVYANAIDQLKGIDVAYDSYVNEFSLGKKRILVKPEMTRNIDGEPVFDPRDTIFYTLPEDSRDGSLIEPVDMTLRTDEHSRGMQDMLNILSSKCGFGEGRYRYDSGSIATATQVISENSAMFRTLRKHETILRAVLTELARGILRLGNTYNGAGLDEDVEISVDFDDSIIEDKTAEFARDMQMLSAGILNDWEFRAKWMNEDAETARSALPGMERLIQ